MASPVVIEFITKGIPDVTRATRTVADAVVASERASTRASQQGAAARIRLSEEEARQKNQIDGRRRASNGRFLADEVLEAQRAAEKEVRAFERAETAKTRIATTEARRRAAEEDRAARASAATRARFASAVAGGAFNGVKRSFGVASQVGGMVTQLGGSFSLADSVQRSTSLTGKLADIASRGTITNLDSNGKPADPANFKKRSTKELEGKVRGVGAEFGIEADTAAEGLDKFASKTGKLNVGMDLLKGLAEMSRAGAGSLDDLADAAGDVFNADTTQNAEQVLTVMRALAGQGKIGAVEMKDLAKQMAGLQAASAKFEGDAGKNMALMGGLAQLARVSGGAKSAPQAVTAVMSLTAQLSKEKRLKGMEGLDVQAKTEGGMNRPLDEIMIDVFKGSEKASRKMGHGLQDFDKISMSAFQDQQARKAVDPLANAYKKAGGGQAGEDAVRGLLKQYAGATLSKEEISGHAKDRMGEADAKMEQIRQKFDQAVSEKIIPKLLDLIPVLEKLIPEFVNLAAIGIPAFVDLIKSVSNFAEAHKGIIEGIAAHPIGAIMAMEVSKSIAAAGLGEILKKAIGGGGGAGGEGAASVLGGAPGAVRAGVAGGVLAGVVAANSELKYAEGTEKAANIAAKVRSFAAGNRTTGMSPEAAAKEVDAAQGRLNATGTFQQVGNIIKSPFSDSASKDYAQYKSDQALVDSKDLQAALKDVAAAFRSGGLPGSTTPKTQPITARATQ